MKSILIVIPHSHSWFWSQTCLASLKRHPPKAEGYATEIIVVDNSPWSPAIRGITDTELGKGVTVIPNHKNNKFHASALDCVVEDYDFDYLMALETDVMTLRPTWLEWFLAQMRPSDYAVGMWHHEQFVNPSCTLYRGDVLKKMKRWCVEQAPQNELRWGENFDTTAPLDHNLHLAPNAAEVIRNMREWIGGPFAEKRGWPKGTTLKEQPSGQLKGPGWYEPGQQLHHWAVNEGHTYKVCPSLTTKRGGDNMPLQTVYGAWGEEEFRKTYPPSARMGCGDLGYNHGRQLEAVELFGNGQTVHLWGGTRALDILKHEVTCGFVKANTPAWLAREARFWKAVVPQDVQTKTLDLIRKYGFHTTGQGNDIPGGNQRDRESAEYVRQCYAEGGVKW